MRSIRLKSHQVIQVYNKFNRQGHCTLCNMKKLWRNFEENIGQMTCRDEREWYIPVLVVRCCYLMWLRPPPPPHMLPPAPAANNTCTCTSCSLHNSSYISRILLKWTIKTVDITMIYVYITLFTQSRAIRKTLKKSLCSYFGKKD